jgi:hypothetical protein
MLSKSAKNDVFSSVGKSDEGEKNFSLSSENDFSLPAMVMNFVPKLRIIYLYVDIHISRVFYFGKLFHYMTNIFV